MRTIFKSLVMSCSSDLHIYLFGIFLFLDSFHHFLYYIILGFPILGIEWQKMENPDLRKSMGLKPDQKGVRVRRVEPTAPESGCLKPSDIILSFDGVDIANDGTG